MSLFDGIRNALSKGGGFLAGRFGTIEFDVCWEYDKWGRINPDAATVLERNAGVFPKDSASVVRWIEATKLAIQNSDLLATGWYAPILKKEHVLLCAWDATALQIPLRALEPYYWEPEKRWSRLLAGQKVCVVSSFTETAASQVAKGGEAIWGSSEKSIWPAGVEWSWVKTGYAPCMSMGRGAWECDAEKWEDAVAYVVEEVCKRDARIVLIGCGGLGMVIADELKRRGKICIVMGGAVQVFFGIKGRRWEKHEFISRLWNENWVYPSLEETPGGAPNVERGCYWG